LAGTGIGRFPAPAVPVPFFAVSFLADVFFGAAVSFCLAQRSRCAAEMRSRAALPSLRRGLPAKSEGVKLVAYWSSPSAVRVAAWLAPLRSEGPWPAPEAQFARPAPPQSRWWSSCRPQLPILSGN